MSRSTAAIETVAALIVGAGAVGVLRQRRERQRVASADLAPVTSATRVVPGIRTGPVARRVGRWVPSRPTSVPGRFLAGVWAAPATLIGALLAALTGGRARWDDERGCLLVTGGARGPARLRGSLGVSANALGHVVTSRFANPPTRLLAHEVAHVRQAERLGPLFLPLYLWWWGRYGYRDHPLERGAREAARRSVAS